MKELGAFFRMYKIHIPEKKIICCSKSIKKIKNIDRETYLSYALAAKELGLESPDIHNTIQKATFSANVILNLLNDNNFQNFIEPSNFSEPTERVTNFQIENKNIKSKPKLKNVSVEELLKRPREIRFKDTYVAFTGTIKKPDGTKRILRKKAIEIIHEMGGLATENFDEHVTHLVVGDGSGRKLGESEELGAVIPEAVEISGLLVWVRE